MVYQYMMAPARQQGKGAGGDGPCLSPAELALELNLRAMNGWEFVGSELLLETRRRWLFLKRSEQVQFLIFRRRVSEDSRETAQAPASRQSAPDDRVAPATAAETAPMPREPARVDLIEAVRAGRRRIVVVPDRMAASP